MKTLLIINGPAYGSDQTFNAIRLALALAKRDDVQPRIFLMGDAVTSAIAGQTVPSGYYHLDRMLKSFVRKGGQIACCGTCMDTRGLTKDHLIEEAPRSTMDELAAWTVDADRVPRSDF